jgi:hypothetical protein
MLNTTISAMTAGGKDTPKITTGTVNDLRALTVPVTELVAKKPSPTYRHVVEEIRPIRDLVQRDMSGAKSTNAKTKLPAYIERKLSHTGEWSGPVWSFTLWLPDALRRRNQEEEPLGQYELDPTNLGFFLDGESRAYSLERLVLEEDDPERRRALLDIPVAIQVYDGIPVERAAQHFRDTNGLGVGITSALLLGHDYEDPWMDVTRKVFAELGIPLEEQARQVKANSPAILTVVAARAMVAAVARGIGAVQYGAGAIPTEIDGQPVNFTKLESAAVAWLNQVFSTLGVTAFKDKNLVLRAVPLVAAIGALGRPFYTDDIDGQMKAKAILASSIDWSAGQAWAGIAGKTNAAGTFSVGSAKENGYAAYKALTDPNDIGYQRLRSGSASVA